MKIVVNHVDQNKLFRYNDYVAYVCLVVVVSILGLHKGVDAVSCYDCDSTISSRCGEPMSNPGSVNICTGATCQKAKGTTDGNLGES